MNVKMKYILLLVNLFLSCEEPDLFKQEMYSYKICKDCVTIIYENGVKIDSMKGFYCGEYLMKQENANFRELIDNKIRETKTICTKSNFKSL